MYEMRTDILCEIQPESVCLVNCFLKWLQPLAAYLRNSRERDFNHPWPVTDIARPIPSKVVTFSRNRFL